VFENLKLAQELGAQIVTVPASGSRGLVEAARMHNLGTLVLGRSPSRPRAFHWSDNFATRAARSRRTSISSRSRKSALGGEQRTPAGNQRRTHGALRRRAGAVGSGDSAGHATVAGV
jgi:K+-sensing histidine kinase KdpD